MQNTLSNIFGKTPFIRFTIPLLLGIITGEYLFRHSFSFVWLAGITGVIYLLLYFFQKTTAYKYRWIWGTLAFTFLFFCGVTLCQQQKRDSELPLGGNILLNAVIAEHPVQKSSSVQLRLAVKAYRQNDIWVKSNESVVVYMQADSTQQTLRAGQRIIILASLQPIKLPSNPEEFDYRSYMQRRGYYATAFIKGNAIDVIEENALPFYKAIPLSLQQGLLNRFKDANIEGQELAVLMALTIGDKQLLDEDVKQAYSSAGVIHILAVSGLHVGLLYMLLTYLLFFLRGKKYKLIIKSVVVLLSLWLYAAMAGFSPSVTRAVIMFSFILLAQLSGRQASTLNAVFASAFFICLFKPLGVFDVGFQLSYFAVLGILAFYPKLNKLIAVENPILKGVWNICCVSFSAQLAVLPFSVFYFHQIPTCFLLANILVLPLVTVATYLIVVLLLVSFIPFLSIAIGYLLSACIYAVSYIVTAVQQLPFALWDNIYLSPIQLVLCLLTLLCLMLLMAYRKRVFTWTVVGCSILALSLSIGHYVKTARQNQLVVFDVGSSSLVAFVSGHNATCIKDDRSTGKSFEYNTNGYFTKQRVSKENIQTVPHSKLDSLPPTNSLRYYKGSFWFRGYIVKMLSRSDSLLSVKQPFPIDILVVGNSSLSPKNVLMNYSPKFIVLDSSVSRRAVKEWTTMLEERDIPYYNVKEKGAFVLSL